MKNAKYLTLYISEALTAFLDSLYPQA